MPACQCLLLDAFGTFLFPRQPIAQTYHEAAVDAGLDITQAQIEQRFPQAFTQHFRGWRQLADDQFTPWSQKWNQSPVVAIDSWQQQNWTHRLDQFFRQQAFSTEADRWKSLIADVLELTPSRSLDLVFDQLWNRFSQPAVWKLDPATPDLLRRASELGIAVGVASNFDRRLETIVAGIPELHSLRFVFHSGELQVPKPAPDFYRTILSRLQLAPEQVWMVGDSLIEDVIVPRSLGMTSRWITRGTPGVVPENLPDLASLLRSLEEAVSTL